MFMAEATACPISARKCCSVIQQYSNPDCSAATAWVNAFQYASRSDVGFQGRGICIWVMMPNFIFVLLLD